MMHFGMPYLLETEELEDCADVCSKLGLPFVEWNMSFPQCQLNKLSAERLLHIQEKYKIYSTIHLDESLNICDFNTRVRQAHLDTVLETIHLAKEIHAPILNMHLLRGVFVTLPQGRKVLFSQYPAHYLECLYAFRLLCEQAIGNATLKISIENTDGFLLHEQEGIELLLESPCFGLTLDIGHCHVAGNMDFPFYENHRHRLTHMHLHDARIDRDHLVLGTGDIDLKQRISMANAANARAVVEVKTIAALTKSVEQLREYL